MRVANQLQLPSTHLIEHVLASHAALSPPELASVRDGVGAVRNHAAGAQLDPQPLSSGHRMVVSGWIGRMNQFPDGRRQVVSLALPGDLLEPPGLPGLQMGYFALTSAQTADVSAIAAAAAREPGSNLAAAWGRVEGQGRDWWVRQVLRLGRLSAYERLASLLLDLRVRLVRCGVASDTAMPLPLTQEMLADILGLSVVHVNRVLQQLRHEDLITYRSGRVIFPDRAGLERAAGF